MRWSELIEAVGDEPVFETGSLLVGGVDPNDVTRQLSRWTSCGNLVQLRRGAYAFAGKWAQGRRRPHGFELANLIRRGSYVSMSSVLSEQGIIPDYVPTVTSVTTGRPRIVTTEVGTFSYRHVRDQMFWGYEWRDLGAGSGAYVACTEKALIDLFYLAPRPDQLGHLHELRLQNLARIESETLVTMAQRTGKKAVVSAAHWVAERASGEAADSWEEDGL